MHLSYKFIIQLTKGGSKINMIKNGFRKKYIFKNFKDGKQILFFFQNCEFAQMFEQHISSTPKAGKQRILFLSFEGVIKEPFVKASFLVSQCRKICIFYCANWHLGSPAACNTFLASTSQGKRRF